MERKMTKDNMTDASRRALLAGSVGIAAAAAAVTSASAAAPKHMAKPAMAMPRRADGFVTTTDGVQIFYKDWGTGQPIVFSHGWPLSADDWDAQMMFFLGQGYRVIAHDRRGHGRSTQTDTGNDMDHYAADLAALTKHLDLHNAIHVGHSTGGGEVVHYVARNQERVAKAVLISAVPPLLAKTDTNPDGIPVAGFDPYRQQTAFNRAQFFLDVPSGPFYNFNKPGVKTIPGLVQNWWRQGMMGGVKAQVDCVKAFSETDFRDDLRAITVPTLVMHSKDDQVVPYPLSGPKSAALLKNGTLKTYADNMPHGMMTTHADIINADLLAFFKA
jgi:non-heme chloroperoxidase